VRYEAVVVVVDNYDSFTYNLVHLIRGRGHEVRVFRNDEVTVDAILELGSDHVVISPGPGRPEGTAICPDLVRACAGRVPLLGVCLGHQVIGHAFGARIVRARSLVHGKTSVVRHHGAGVFAGLADPLEAMRYHSLAIDPRSLPDCLEVTAWIEDEPETIMGLRHRELELEGIQFHPESFLTADGEAMVARFLSTHVVC